MILTLMLFLWIVGTTKEQAIQRRISEINDKLSKHTLSRDILDSSGRFPRVQGLETTATKRNGSDYTERYRKYSD